MTQSGYSLMVPKQVSRGSAELAGCGHEDSGRRGFPGPRAGLCPGEAAECLVAEVEGESQCVRLLEFAGEPCSRGQDGLAVNVGL